MKFIKWAVGTIMVLVLLAGVGTVAAANISIATLPKGVEDLEKVRVTIKSLIVGPNLQLMTPQEYPTQFEIPGTSPVEGVSPMAVMPDVKATDPKLLLIKVGDSADVYLKKGNAKELQSKTSAIMPVMIAYGIILANGKVLSDPNETISGKNYQHQKKIGYEMIAVPILYFLLLISCSAFRRKKLTKK